MKKLPKQYTIKNLKLIFSIILLALSFYFLASVVSAQQRTITISFPVVEHSLNPGEKVQGVTRIVNDSDEPLKINIGVQDFIVTDTAGTPNLLPPNTLNSKYSAASWIGVAPNEFIVPPQKRQDLEYFIQVPSNARPGGHYAAIVYTPQSEKNPSQSGSAVTTQLGSLFKIIIKGPVNEQANITKFTSNPYSEYGPVKILTRITNQGDIHTRPNAKIKLTGLFVNKSYDLSTSPKDVFPGTSRNYETFVGSKYMMGRYKAELTGTYGFNSTFPLTATLYFWVFPWQIALIIVLIIVAIILAAIYLKRKKENRKTKNEETESIEEKTGVLSNFHSPTSQ